MVVRKRIRTALYALVLYACCGAASAYFVDTALNGERGLKTKDDYRRQMASLNLDLGKLRAQHGEWQHRIDLLRSEAIDSDLLEEEARATLDDVDPRDLVIFTKPIARP